MFSHGFMSFAAIGVTVACLLIMGTFTLVAYNANENLADLQQENAIVAFVDETLEESEARALQTQIESTENVADCTFVSRTEARDAYVEKYDDGGVYGDLDATVFRHRFVIHVTDPNRIMETKTAVDNIPGIDKARADEAVANGFTTVRNVAGVISVALIAILLLVSVFIISNTIKLTTFDRRDEIAIMKMVGATNGFIRWPFVYEGLLLGLFSAVIAFGLQWGLYAAVAQGIANSDSLQILNVVPFTRIWQFVALVFLGTGIRISECVGLNIDDFDFEQNAFVVTRKGGKEVILYLSDEVADALKDYLAERKEIEALPGHENAFFLSIQRRRITQRAVENMVKKYAAIAAPLKKKISPHKLRSTFGTNLYRETGDIYLVADVLGHSDVNTTRKHYAAIAEDHRRIAAQKTVLREEPVHPKSPE